MMLGLAANPVTTPPSDTRSDEWLAFQTEQIPAMVRKISDLWSEMPNVDPANQAEARRLIEDAEAKLLRFNAFATSIYNEAHIGGVVPPPEFASMTTRPGIGFVGVIVNAVARLGPLMLTAIKWVWKFGSKAAVGTAKNQAIQTTAAIAVAAPYVVEHAVRPLSKSVEELLSNGFGAGTERVGKGVLLAAVGVALVMFLGKR